MPGVVFCLVWGFFICLGFVYLFFSFSNFLACLDEMSGLEKGEKKKGQKQGKILT